MNRSKTVGPTRFTRAVASVSWIDSRLFPRLAEVDFHAHADFRDPATIPRDRIVGRSGYRFANLLEVAIEVDGDRRIKSGQFTQASRIYRNTSFLGIDSEVYEICGSRSITPTEAKFVQLVGCRTQSPEKIAEALGFRLGREFVEEVYVFPPIWTELSLTVRSDGTSEGKMTRHSLFPSVSVFEQSGQDLSSDWYRRIGNYDGIPGLKEWDNGGWGAFDGMKRGNPWNIPRPVGWGSRRDTSHGQCPRPSLTEPPVFGPNPLR